MPRKTQKLFYLNDEHDKPISAGGIIIYKFDHGNMLLLLQESRGSPSRCSGNIEDLGGLVDKDDEDIYDTISREAKEETNNILSKSKIKKRIKLSPFAYTPRSKYVIYVIEANDFEKNLVSDDFGTREEHDDFERIIKWIPLNLFLTPEFIKHKLAWRLRNGQLFNILKKIDNDKKISSNMFFKKNK